MQSGLKELAELLLNNTMPRTVSLDETVMKPDGNIMPNFIFVPKGMELQSTKRFIDEHKKVPDRRRGKILTDDIGSFVDLVNRNKNTDSVVFARCDASENCLDAALVSIIDYHPSGSDNDKANNCEFRIIYPFPLSSEIKRWVKLNGVRVSQLQFAQFLEDRIIEISTPSEEATRIIKGLGGKCAEGIEMLELARDLEIYSTSQFKSRQKISSGEYEMKFTSEHKDATGKPITIPDYFVIKIPLFSGEIEAKEVIARLRYRIKDNSSVEWFFELYRLDVAFKEQFRQTCAAVKQSTDLPLYFVSEIG